MVKNTSNPVPGITYYHHCHGGSVTFGGFLFQMCYWKVCWHQGQNGLSWMHANPWVSVSQRYELVLLSSTHSCTNYTAKLLSSSFIGIILYTDLNLIEKNCAMTWTVTLHLICQMYCAFVIKNGLNWHI